MSIKYEPSKLIRRLKVREKAARLVTKRQTVNKTALKSLTEFGVLPKKVAEDVALGVIKQHKKSGNDVSEKQLQARIQSAALHEQTRVIKRAYRGEYYEWLKSTAKDPRPEHVENYGKIFQIGVGDENGDDPGDLYGCQCGMRILVDETPEEFNERLEDAI